MPHKEQEDTVSIPLRTVSIPFANVSPRPLHVRLGFRLTDVADSAWQTPRNSARRMQRGAEFRCRQTDPRIPLQTNAARFGQTGADGRGARASNGGNIGLQLRPIPVDNGVTLPDGGGRKTRYHRIPRAAARRSNSAGPGSAATAGKIWTENCAAMCGSV